MRFIQHNRTSLAEGLFFSASLSNIETVISSTSIGHDTASKTQMGAKRKIKDEYKVVPIPAFRTFKDLCKPATRETEVKNHLHFISERNTEKVSVRHT